MILLNSSFTSPTFAELLPWFLCAVMGAVATIALVLLYRTAGAGRPLRDTTEAGESSVETGLLPRPLTAADLRNFLQLGSVYRDNYDELLKLSRRKLKGGQTEELMAHLQSDSLTKQPLQIFLRNFDEALLSAMPDFPQRLNSLLAENHRITSDSASALGPEMRIAALIALGLTDSSSIASMLGLSLNTVYAYRNRLRGRAPERGKLEQKLSSLLP